jgi:uncharacterized protein
MARISKSPGKLIPHRVEWSEGMLTNKDRKIAEQLKRRLLASDGTRIQRVLLYGSRAKGTATKESDFDLLVVEKDPVAKREEMMRLRQVVSDQTHAVDIWVMGEQEFEETKDVIGGLAYPAHKYGLVLYENTWAGEKGDRPVFWLCHAIGVEE